MYFLDLLYQKHVFYMGRRVSMPDSRMCGLCSSLAPPRHQTQTKTQAPKHRQGTAPRAKSDKPMRQKLVGKGTLASGFVHYHRLLRRQQVNNLLVLMEILGLP